MSTKQMLQRGLGVMPRIRAKLSSYCRVMFPTLQRGLGVMPRISSRYCSAIRSESWLQRGLGVMPRIRE